MILRRLTDAFRKQDWFTVAVETLIVVLGVFLGLQVSNWNAARTDAANYREAMRRLSEESSEILRDSEVNSQFVNARLANVQTAIALLEACRTGEEAEAAVELGLNSIRASEGGPYQSDAVTLLVTDERLLARQSQEDRARLRQYARSLAEISTISTFLRDAAGIGETDAHPLVGFTAAADPAESLNGVDVRRARIVRPLDEACKDPTFLKRFYQWERTHVFQLEIHKVLRETVVENSLALGLSVKGPEPEDAR